MQRLFPAFDLGHTRWLSGPAAAVPQQASETVGGITSEEEAAELIVLNAWMHEQSLPLGTLANEVADPATGEQRAVFDLAWPAGIQEELSQPVAVLLNEEPATLALASAAGFRCFTSPSSFRAYVELVYLALPSVDLSILRVAERVAHGGHSVQYPVLRRRFPRSIRLLLDAYAPAVDHVLCNMNAGGYPVPVFSQTGATRTIIDPVLYAHLLELAR